MQKMQTSGAAPDFMLSAEVMELARISRRTLDRWVAEGILPAYQVSERTVRRYRRDHVDAILRGEKVEAGS